MNTYYTPELVMVEGTTPHLGQETDIQHLLCRYSSPCGKEVVGPKQQGVSIWQLEAQLIPITLSEKQPITKLHS